MGRLNKTNVEVIFKENSYFLETIKNIKYSLLQYTKYIQGR